MESWSNLAGTFTSDIDLQILEIAQLIFSLTWSSSSSCCSIPYILDWWYTSCDIYVGSMWFPFRIWFLPGITVKRLYDFQKRLNFRLLNKLETIVYVEFWSWTECIFALCYGYKPLGTGSGTWGWRENGPIRSETLRDVVLLE